MYRLKACIIVVLSCWAISAKSQLNYEKLAVEFFFAEIYDIKHANNSFEFSGCTESSLSYFSNIKDCFAEDQSIRVLLFQNDDNGTKKKIELERFDEIKIKKKSRRKLIVYGVNNAQDHFYVRIDIYEKKLQTYSYFIKMNQVGEILTWCESGMIH